MITAQALNGSDRVRHAFFTREGGVSQGVYASLNCGFGSDDNPDHVTANRATAMDRLGLGGGDLLTLYQTHSATVFVAQDLWDPDQAPEADACVTKTPGVALGILTADCAPVLLADEEAGVIGAAHAGWKGALGGVAASVVDAMCGLGAECGRIHAAIGPCIRQPSYEVGPEFHTQFMDADSSSQGFFLDAKREGHFMFDLPGYLGQTLEALGLAAVETVPGDTCGDETRFFSYRRATLRGEKDYGRGLAAICIKEYGRR
ncbi:MAG: peptidoglycan editing factor PgeF [Rhodospirillales bacterium]|nr:peptidoglycan editing factor PgeF [Rhodospirillales bacterium]